MHYVLIIHEVADYAAWKDAFDRAAGIRRDAGELSYQLLRAEADANQVVHFSRWSSLESARRFFLFGVFAFIAPAALAILLVLERPPRTLLALERAVSR